MSSIIKVLLLEFLLFISITNSKEIKTGPISVTRTELKVSRSLNPEDTQTLNVMTRDGNVAQLIVKRRDPKTNQLPSNTIDVDKEVPFGGSSQYTSALYTNWIPVSTIYWKSKNDTTQLEKLVNTADRINKTETNIKRNNIIESDRIPLILPNPINIRSEGIYVKSQVDSKRGRSLIQIDNDGIPVVHGVRVPDDETDKNIWRNARVINGELHPYEAGYKPPAVVSIGELIYAEKDKPENGVSKGLGPFNKEDNYQAKNTVIKSVGPFTVRDNINGQKEDSQVNSKSSSYSGFGPFTKQENSMLTSKLYEQIRQVNNKESKRGQYSARHNRNVAYFDQQETPEMQRRMLQYPGSPSYPNSLLYTPSTKLSSVTFTEGIRSPVLQYAHPELGVQPAKATAEMDDYKTDGTNYYTSENSVSYANVHDMGRQSQSYGNSVEYYKKDVLNYPYGGYYLKRKPEQPFWIKITDSIRDNMQSGLERMQQLTRPVFEPLVEASQKISYNLGFTHNHNQYRTKAQDKVGFITTPVGTSVILPALGLVAGGAALGLGAAAVGRFLDPTGMRAAPDDIQYPNGILLVMEEDARQAKSPNQAEHRRIRRSSGDGNEFVFVMEDDYDIGGANRLRRTNSDDMYMQQIALNIYKDNDLQHLTAPNLWSDTPCSKRLFCDVMVKQNEDDVIFMEKKMEVLLAIVPQEVRESVSQHLKEVMLAVKEKNCSSFTCAQSLPTFALT